LASYALSDQIDWREPLSVHQGSDLPTTECSHDFGPNRLSTFSDTYEIKVRGARFRHCRLSRAPRMREQVPERAPENPLPALQN
jgi:hypothetical protein